MQPSTPSPAADLPRQSLDLAFRALWRHRPDALATVALGKPVLAVQTEPAAVLVTERAPDGVATVVTDKGACTLHLEFETSVKPAELPRRMAHAGWLLHGPREGLPVRSVALLLDPKPSLPTTYAMMHGDDVVNTYAYDVVALSALEVDELLDAPDHQAGLLALVPLARGAREEHLVAAARRLQHLGSPDAPDLAVVSVMLGSRRFGYTDLIRIFNEEFLMLGDAWANIENRGFERGVVQGRQEGVLQGRHAAARTALHTVASARFGAALDPVLSTVADDQLDAAIAALATAPDAEAARERVAKLGG